jgi:sugar/nucleoside kinase (ribokinase family)
VTQSPEVVTIGHAIVDVLASTPDHLPGRFGRDKGTMTLVELEQAEEIYGAMGPAAEVSGGCAANTAAGVTSLGGSAAFIGKVRNDQLGDVFTHDIRAAGVHFVTPAATDGPATGRCLIMITPDAERTMSTYLGAGDYVYPSDLDGDLLGQAQLVYVEGYMCGLASTDETLVEAARLTHAGGGRFALSLSDPFWVELHGQALAALLDKVDIVFGNEAEALGITGTQNLDEAVAALAARSPIVAVTLGAAGSIVATEGKVVKVAAYPPDAVIDTTGAGDLYASGFLYGLTRGMDPEQCARLGGLAAAEVISHVGARPQVPLVDEAKSAGLLD